MRLALVGGARCQFFMTTISYTVVRGTLPRTAERHTRRQAGSRARGAWRAVALLLARARLHGARQQRRKDAYLALRKVILSRGHKLRLHAMSARTIEH